jgi:tetratricopeptide (TPR) repeat protein
MKTGKMKKEASQQLTPKRKIFFWVITILLPFLLLLAAEGILRLIGFGNYQPLFLIEKRFGAEKWVINPRVTQRYFNLPDNIIPEASPDEYFSLEKSSKTLRVFCMGGSTTAGFPFEVNATFPFQLEHRLQQAFPDREIEVVNLGISAVNSFTVLDLLPEVLEKQPDILAIYTGHNEFYGAFGVASTQQISGSRALIRTYLWLKRWRLVQFIENLLQREKADLNTITGRGLMAVMTAKPEIAYSDPDVKRAIRNFRENLQDIIAAASEKNVPVVLGTLVCNLADQPPFVSGFSQSTDPALKNRLNAWLLEAKAQIEAANLQDAQALLQKIAAEDSSAAEVAFLLGKIAEKNGDPQSAYQYYVRARDLDMLRFRAPSDFNEVLRELAAEQHTALVDLELIFQKASPNSLPGNNFFMEHLHPNFAGNQLIAESYATMIKQQLSNTEGAPKTAVLSEATVNRISRYYMSDSGGVTMLDLEFGHLRTFFLRQKWPFNAPLASLRDYRPVGDELTKQHAIDHVTKSVYWDESHYRLAAEKSASGDTIQAFRELAAVQIAFPENYVPDMKIGDLYFSGKKFENAAKAYAAALIKSPQNPNLMAKLGTVLVAQNKFTDAIHHLKAATLSGKLDRKQQVGALYLLGLSYANTKNFNNAEDVLNRLLMLEPQFSPGQRLLQRIQQYRSQLNQ